MGSQMAEIKPCPFCGHTNVEILEGSTFRWRFAGCVECGAQSGEIRAQTTGDGTPDEWEAKARADAIEEWNKRAAV
jgi:Lar family restriction alleviation protein